MRSGKPGQRRAITASWQGGALAAETRRLTPGAGREAGHGRVSGSRDGSSGPEFSDDPAAAQGGAIHSRVARAQPAKRPGQVAGTRRGNPAAWQASESVGAGSAIFSGVVLTRA